MASGAGTKNATFDGKGWALKDGYTYGAYYPFVGAMYLDRNAVPVSYTGQTQVGNGSMAHLGDYDYMVATPTAPEYGSAQFMFKHLSALVQLKITVPQPATFTSVKLVTDTKAFAVERTVDIMADAPSITPVTSSTEVVLNLEDVATTKENEVVTFCFMLPPTDLSGKSLKAVLASNKGNVEVELESKNFKAGTAYALTGNWGTEDSTGDGSYKDGVVSLAKAGTMRDLLGKDYLNITSLKVVGPINGDDVYYLRKMMGYKSLNEEVVGKLTTLDLSKVSIVKGGEWYYKTSSSKYYYTSNDMIGQYMFYGCKNLQNIVLPDNVTSIGEYAFESCNSLTSVTMGDGVTLIGNDAFRGCSSLKSVYITDLSAWCKIAFSNVYSNPLRNGAKLYLNNKEVTELVIPEDIMEIKDYAFCGCKSIVKVTIGDNVTSIGSSAFNHCSALTTIEIPDNVTSIGEYAFDGCTSLTSVTMGDGVTSIGNSAFSDCSSLTSVTLGKGITTIGRVAFSDCSSLTSIDIPDNVTSIGEFAFHGCTSLTSVTMGDGVTSIGNNAFEGCSSLTSIDILDNVTSIGKYAFHDCI